MRRARHVPEELQRLYVTYGFESILLDYPKPVPGAPVLDKDEAMNSTLWALVYWDDLSLLYVRRGGIYDRVIKEDEYKYVRPANGIRSVRLFTSKGTDRENFILELQRNGFFKSIRIPGAGL